MTNILITKEVDIIVNSVTGKVTTFQIVEHIKGNAENWIGCPVLWNFSNADLGDITSDEWERMLNRLKTIPKNRSGEKTALVSATDLPFGMMRMFGTFAEMKEFSIMFECFRGKDEAKKWLLEE